MTTVVMMRVRDMVSSLFETKLPTVVPIKCQRSCRTDATLLSQGQGLCPWSTRDV